MCMMSNKIVIYLKVLFYCMFYSNLRVDSLAQVLERSCVRAGSRFLVCESCLGLITGALLERMAGKYCIVVAREND